MPSRKSILKNLTPFMELFDTHAHLYAAEFDADRTQMLQTAFQNGVNHIALPAIDSQTHEQQLNLAAQYPKQLFALMGVHPTSVNQHYKHELAQAEKYLASGQPIYGIGETGIDLYWDKTYYNQQVETFKIQINWAKELKLPIIIHTRDSFAEVMQVLEPLVEPGLTGIFHCFGGSYEQARQIIDMGFYLGIGGVVTFKNSQLPQVLKSIDLNHIVLETDSPYLAPVPHRGKRNQSSYLALVAQKIAEIHGASFDKVAKTTTQNAKTLFKLP